MESTTLKSKFTVSRRIAQITDTIQFEFVKNAKKILLLVLIAGVIFLLNVVIQGLDINNGMKIPTDPKDYIIGYLGYIDFLIIIITVTIGGSIIATEFEKQTGNLVFPKISRERLLMGRFIGSALQTIMVIAAYYFFIAIAVLIYYGTKFPIEYWYSLGFNLRPKIFSNANLVKGKSSSKQSKS